MNVKISLLILFSFITFQFKTIKSELNDKPKVSIITSLYNGDIFIEGFLKDIIQQTIFKECELIIINANSPGKEEEIIKEYMKKFSNIIYKKLEKDPGLYATWNMAIRMAKADFITNANLDDRHDIKFLETHLKSLQENPEIDLVYSGFYVTENKNETFECNIHRWTFDAYEFLPQRMRHNLPGPNPMWRKSIHEKYGYFDESFYWAGDFEFWNRIVSMGAKFKPIQGYSTLFYENLSEISHQRLERVNMENKIITGKYISMWNSPVKYEIKPIKQYYCTSANSRYFPHLKNLIGSIHNTNYENLQEIAVFDLGMSNNEIDELKKIEKVNVYKLEMTNPEILTEIVTAPWGRRVPGCFAWKPVAIKQGLELFPYVFYIDAGATILKPMDDIFEHIIEKGYFLSSNTAIAHNNIVNRITKPVLEEIVYKLPEETQKKILAENTIMIIAGVQGLSRKMVDNYVLPMYQLSKNINLFKDDSTAKFGYGEARHDQTLFSILVHCLNLKVHPEGWFDLETKNGIVKYHIHYNQNEINDRTIIYSSRHNINYKGGFTKYIKYKKI